MGRLDGKVAVITGGRQDALDEAVKQIGRNVTGIQGDAAGLDDLDRLYAPTPPSAPSAAGASTPAARPCSRRGPACGSTSSRTAESASTS